MEGESEYFDGYGCVDVHRLMLDDTERVEAYRSALEGYDMKGKTVLDVGAGSGILSLICARAGAAVVYAVEASSIYEVLEEIVKRNGYNSVIIPVKGDIEKVELPVKEVDVIVSEWMGFYLLHECMLRSVIYSRDKWLRAGGVMFPSHADIYGGLVSSERLWKKYMKYNMEYFGFDFTALHERLGVTEKPFIDYVEKQEVINYKKVFSLDMSRVSVDDIKELSSSSIFFEIDCCCNVSFVIIWFDVIFQYNSRCSNNNADNNTKTLNILSTAPWCEQTHWKQTIVPITESIEPLAVYEGMKIESQFILQETLYDRNYTIRFQVLDVC